jgi:hypothetical protein
MWNYAPDLFLEFSGVGSPLESGFHDRGFSLVFFSPSVLFRDRRCIVSVLTSSLKNQLKQEVLGEPFADFPLIRRGLHMKRCLQEFLFAMGMSLPSCYSRRWGYTDYRLIRHGRTEYDASNNSYIVACSLLREHVYRAVA